MTHAPSASCGAIGDVRLSSKLDGLALVSAPLRPDPCLRADLPRERIGREAPVKQFSHDLAEVLSVTDRGEFEDQSARSAETVE
jgi:hypothetical protein